MSSFRPEAGGVGAHLTYSPYVLPAMLEAATPGGDKVKAVKVSSELFELEPMAYKFLITFAHDNGLTIEGEPLVGPTVR
jgi:Protein of unknown function (DUF3579)